MTLFIDLRASESGGVCAAEPSLWDDGTQLVTYSDFVGRVQGRDLILAAHGFNVNRSDGIQALTNWSNYFQLTGTSLFVGILWPGDSSFVPIIDYPIEGSEAIQSGKLLASFLNGQSAGAASISLVSHSLGARTVLETLNGLNGNVRRLILMAGAIEDDCLVNEYQQAANKAQEIYVLSSRSDLVLELAFPIGNPVGEIVMHGHPYFKQALGREGPAQPIPLAQQGGAWQIPDGWNYGHLDYLADIGSGPSFQPPVVDPAPTDPVPVDPAPDGWKPSWSAGAVSTQVL